MRKIFYSSRVVVKCCTKEILCAHRLLKIRGNIGPILFVGLLYTADAENRPNKMCMASSTTATQTIHSFTSLFQSGWLPTDSSSTHPSVSFYGSPTRAPRVAVYLTTLPSHYYVILKSDQLTPPQTWRPL